MTRRVRMRHRVADELVETDLVVCLARDPLAAWGRCPESSDRTWGVWRGPWLLIALRLPESLVRAAPPASAPPSPASVSASAFPRP